MSAASSKPQVTCWLLDTRSIWPGDKIQDAAAEALALVSETERADIIRKYHIQDARMSLASALLKRFFVCTYSPDQPWSSVRFGRKHDDKHGKPCALSPNSSSKEPLPVEFNVSHQAGLVALVGTTSPGVELGVDIVCVNERNDFRVIDKDGFEAWVDIYADIFSAEEQNDMKYSADSFQLLDGIDVLSEQLSASDRHCCVRNRNLLANLPSGEKRTFSSDLLIDAKLRRFYTFWCYKEAYIKLTGEALLAKWIAECEFKKVRSPKQGTEARCSTLGTWGELVGDAEVWLQGKKLEDVRLEIRAFEEKYMIAVAAKPQEKLDEGEMTFKNIRLEDILELASER